MKNVVVIGGGTGQSALLRGLKQVEDIQLSTIVTMADDGGSTGRLRSDLHIPAMGDVRSVMMALAESESVMGTLMNYRFDNNSGSLAGQSLGNLILSALTKQSGNFAQAIADLSRVLRVRGTIIPSTLNDVTLFARMTDGTEIEGEHNITEAHKRIQDVYYKQYVSAYPDTLVAIREADYIIIGLGSLYTSILPNLIIGDIRDALVQAKANTVYYCNCMTEEGETDGYTMEDHVDTINRHLRPDFIDAVVVANDPIPADIMDNYVKEHAEAVAVRDAEHSYQVMQCSLLDYSSGKIRHDPAKVRDSFIRLMEEF